MRYRPSLAIVFATAVVVPAVIARTPSGPAQKAPDQQRPPVFRGGANAVQVDVYPSRDGRIVEGLTAADFQVFEDGVRQQIEDLQFIRIEGNAPLGERVDPNTIEDAHREAADPRNRVFVLFLDHYHINLEGSYRLRRPLVNMLHRLLTPTDLFGVMTPLLRARDLTLGRRTETIEALLDRHWAWGVTASKGEPDAEDEWRIRCVEARYPVSLPRWHMERMFTALEGLTEHLGRVREARKVVLFFSSGWNRFTPIQRAKLKPALPGVGVDPFGRLTTAPAPGGVDGARCNAEALRLDALDSDEMLRRFFDAARRNNVSIYPVNPSGLETPEVITGGDIQRQFDSIRDRRQLLLTIAENTDGIAVGSNDMAADLRRVVDDVSAYYMLSYMSTNSAPDGKFRRIEVKLRPAGIAVKARRGYVAASAEELARARDALPAPPSAPAAVDVALAALERLRPDVELHAAAAAAPSELIVVIEWPVDRSLPASSSAADVQVAVVDARGDEAGHAVGRIEPPSRATIVRVPLADGSVGPWTVSARAGAGTGARLEPLEVAPPRGALVGEPMLYRARPGPRAPLQPVADRRFRRTERLRIDWPLGATADRRDARLLGRNGAPLAVPVTVTERDVNGQPTVSVDLSLTPLSEADYLVELTVGKGGDVERTLVAFRVVR